MANEHSQRDKDPRQSHQPDERERAPSRGQDRNQDEDKDKCDRPEHTQVHTERDPAGISPQDDLA